MSQEWYYRTQTGDAGLNRKPPRLKDLGEHSVRIFVREVIQNNLDAAEEGKSITVDIRLHEWKNKEVQSFFEFIGADHISLLKKSAIDPDPSVATFINQTLEVIQGKKSKYFTVIVEEKNCIGLLGPVRENKQEKSHFDALMRKVENNEAKKETTNTGGTWGKGSSIFTYTSLLWTWFSYSKLSEPWFDKENQVEHKKRFIGRCMIAPFFDSGSEKSFLGDGWFCDKEHGGKIDAFPFINNKADEYAIKLGLSKRENESGTTFFIPFFKPQLANGDENINLTVLYQEFIEQILQNWFIPIYNGLLVINVSTENEITTLDKNYLHKVESLKFKLQLLDWYENGCPPVDNKFIREPIEIDVPALRTDIITERTGFAKQRQKIKSDLLIRVLNDDEDFTDKWNTTNTVALCRNKGMIITDEPFLDSKDIRTESILFSGLMSKAETSLDKKKHLDLFLGYTENPAHNTWCRHANDYDRCFLDRFEGKRPKPEASVNQLFNEIFKVFKKLVEEDSGQKEKKDINSIFKKLAKLKSTGDASGGKSIFHLRSISDDVDGEGRSIFTRRVISAVENSDIDVFFKSYISSLEGDKDKDFDILGIKEFSYLEILNEENEIISSGENPKISLQPNEEIIIKIRTCNIESNPFFKNVEPFIKSYANLLNNE